MDYPLYLSKCVKINGYIKGNMMNCHCCQVCPDCGKSVRNKFIFGRLHFCLSDEGKKELELARWQIREQKKLNKNGEIKWIGFKF